MYNYEHKKIIDAINNLDKIPADSNEFSDWIKAKSHLTFLEQNALENELVIFASGEYTWVNSVVVPNDVLLPIDKNELMKWGVDPYHPIASYVMGGGRDDVWIERGLREGSSDALENGVQLIFGRTFNGWTGQGRN